MMSDSMFLTFVLSLMFAGCLPIRKPNTALASESSSYKNVQKKPKPIQVKKPKPVTYHKCPKCGSRGVPIVYGKPGRALMEKAKKKEVYLGGCCRRPNAPRYHCYKCGTNFSGIRK